MHFIELKFIVNSLSIISFLYLILYPGLKSFGKNDDRMIKNSNFECYFAG